MTSKYVIGGGARASPQQRPMYQGSVILDGITKLEKTIAGMRREQWELWQQMQRQREWLDEPDNQADPRYEQRLTIYEDRQMQYQDLEQRAGALLDVQQGQIESLEGSEKLIAIQRLLSWSEAPFVLALFVIGGLA